MGEIVADDFNVIRKQLEKFGGGEVTLTKNENGIAFICLDHPQKRNAISGVMAIQLRKCVDVLENWKEGKAVILFGKGNNFCSGGDLECERGNMGQKEGLNLITWLHDALNRLQQLPLVSVCIVQGPTLGGGAEICMSCDYIVTVENAKMGFVHGIMGLSPGWAGGLKLVKKIGAQKALDLLLTSKILSASECVTLGLADALIPAENFLEETLNWLKPRIQHHYSVTRAMKQVILNEQLYSYMDALEKEKQIMLSLWGKEANQNALKNKIKHVKAQ